MLYLVAPDGDGGKQDKTGTLQHNSLPIRNCISLGDALRAPSSFSLAWGQATANDATYLHAINGLNSGEDFFFSFCARVLFSCQSRSTARLPVLHWSIRPQKPGRVGQMPSRRVCPWGAARTQRSYLPRLAIGFHCTGSSSNARTTSSSKKILHTKGAYDRFYFRSFFLYCHQYHLLTDRIGNETDDTAMAQC